MSQAPEPPRPTSDPKPGKTPVQRPEDELPPDADIEERFQDFWKKNGNSIFITILAAALVVAAVQGYRLYERRAQASLQQDFVAAAESSAWVDFAQEHAGTKLAGVALAQAAAETYRATEFAPARDLFGRASKAGSGVIKERARLGAAAAALRAGSATAMEDLEAIAQESAALTVTRVEAYFLMAAQELENGNPEAAEPHLDAILLLDSEGQWTRRVESLREAARTGPLEASEPAAALAPAVEPQRLELTAPEEAPQPEAEGSTPEIEDGE